MNKKRIGIILLVISMLVSNATLIFADDYQTLYADDGRTICVHSREVGVYTNLGWYVNPVQKIYAPDGRMAVVEKSSVENYIKVGWYAAPVQIMYAPDGRNIVVLKSEAAAYNSVGWYYEPVTLMYAGDGRTIYVGNSQIQAYKNVGWSIQPPNQTTIAISNKNESNAGSGTNNSVTVYATPTGKRYHLRSSCGGKNSFSISLQGARNRGLTPCKKCAY